MKKIPHISTLQTTGVILVCLFHSLVGEAEGSFLYSWIHLFVIPLFVYLSGYLFSYTNQELKNPRVFLVRKTKRLLVPYWLISSLAFIPKSLLSSLAIRPVPLTWTAYFRMLLYPFDNVIIYYWFIPTLFVILLVAYGFFRFAPNVLRQPLPVLTALVILHFFNPLRGIMFINLEGVVEHLIFFGLGYYSCSVRLHDMIEGNKYWLAGLSLAVTIICVRYSDTQLTDFIGTLCGIIMCVTAALLYHAKNYSFLQHMEGAYYTIYLLSWFPQVFSYHILNHFFDVPLIITILLSWISGVYVPLVIHRLFKL